MSLYCKCGAPILQDSGPKEHRGDPVCEECRRAGLKIRYEHLEKIRRMKAQEGIDKYWKQKREEKENAGTLC